MSTFPVAFSVEIRMGVRLAWWGVIALCVAHLGCEDAQDGPSVVAGGETSWELDVHADSAADSGETPIDTAGEDAIQDGGQIDALPDGGEPEDAGSLDGGASDASTADSELLDGIGQDSVGADAGEDGDTGSGDAEPTDAEPTDAEPTDAEPTDATGDDASDVELDAVEDGGATDSTTSDVTEPDDASSDGGGGEPDGGAGGLCEDLPAYPALFTTVSGIGGSEDYAFDANGNVIINQGGNIVRVNQSGGFEILAPNIGGTAGIGVLPQSGDIIVCQGNSLVRVYKDGGSETILSGLAYPNGLDVDQDDYVYVGEQSANRLRRVNTTTGEFEILSNKVPNANGVAFAPGYDRVYVGSFGGGTIHYIDRYPDGTWGDTVLFAKIDGNNTQIGELPEEEQIDPPDIVHTPCAGAVEGATCVDEGGYTGSCQVDAPTGQMACVVSAGAPLPELAACAGKAENAGCAVSLWGYTFHGKCSSSGSAEDCCEATGVKGCSSSACEECVCGMDAFCCQTQWDGICAGEAQNQCDGDCNCGSGGLPPGVDPGELYCDWSITPTVFCQGLSEGDICPYVESFDSILGGRCTDVAGLSLPSNFPKKGIACVPPQLLVVIPPGGGGGGGLDGLNVDECGNVYVTEYVLGYVWRIRPDGVIAPPVKLPASWIPNMEFGRGVGGWDAETLYVVDFSKKAMYGIDIGLRGKEATMPPPGTFGP